ncbi:MAG TPA: hypothetical protein ENJ19_11755 [Gammaproteobacteria bacterium]|nr:hypothetical protein [Gammaproteobacteria bacterium]
MTKTMKAILLGLTAYLPLPAGAVVVSLTPSTTDITVGDLLTVDIVADIPLTEPVLGWGLDLDNASGLLTATGSPLIGSAWIPAFGFDGDGLAGLAFPLPVVGDDTLLATLTFEAVGAGTALLMPGYTATDLTEGFALSPFDFASTSFTGLSLTIKEASFTVPEPPTALLLALCGAGFGMKHYRRRKRRQ